MSASPIRDLIVGLFVFAGIAAIACLSATDGEFCAWVPLEVDASLQLPDHSSASVQNFGVEV
jgi:hypothetical protein